MRLLHALTARLRLLLGRRAHEARMDEEFRFHIEMETEKNVREGLSPVAARRRAMLAFGATETYRETLREGRGIAPLEDLLRDARHAARSLARSPAFTIAAVLTLALGVSANATMFSLLNARLFRPLPFDEPDRLVVVQQAYRAAGGYMQPVRWSYPEFEVLRPTVSAVMDVAAYNVADASVQAAAGAVRVGMELVTPSYFHVLRVAPVRGRVFVPGEGEGVGTSPLAVLSYDLWQREFGGSDEVVGRAVQVNGVALTVAGVTSAGFRGLSGAADLWVLQTMAPLVSVAEQLTTAQHFLTVVGRLRSGVPLEAAGARVAAVAELSESAARIERAGSGAEWWTGLSRLGDLRKRDGTAQGQLALAGAVSLVLLLAVVNLAGLLMARSVARRRELSVRAALGAGRRRLVQQALTEDAVIGGLGGAVGVMLAAGGIRVLTLVLPDRLGPAEFQFAHVAAFADPVLDWRVLGYCFVLAVFGAMAAGLGPAVATVRKAGMNRGGVSAGTRFTANTPRLRRPGLLAAVLVAQVACAFALLAGASALMRELHRLQTRDVGVVEQNLLSFRISPPESRYAGAAASQLQRHVLERVQAVPGVTAATVSRCMPFMRCSSAYVYEAESAREPVLVGRHYVGPDHFRTLGIPVLRGRALDPTDDAAAPRVAVISESAARRLWPGENPLGRRVWFSSGHGFDSPDSPTEIVGIVGDVLYDEPDAGAEFYTSYQQFAWPATLVIVRSELGAGVLLPALRAAIADVDAGIPVHDVATLADRRAAAVAGERFATLAIGSFALLALLLAAVGVYGVTAYSVAQRRRELGVRAALGATKGSLLRLVVGTSATLVAAGLIAGAALSSLLVRVLTVVTAEGNITLSQPLLLAAPVLIGVTLLASWIPARRAALVDPRQALTEG